MDQGKKIFLEQAEPRCAVCHTLADAGAKGTLGPSLDDVRPDYERVIEAVRNGIEAMPAFGDQLSEEQIKAVAEYVSTVAGEAK